MLFRSKADLNKNISIGIFPEATIPVCTPKLGPVKNGAFRLAIENKVPIVPITYVNCWKIIPDYDNKIFGGRPGLVKIYIHEPVETGNISIQEIGMLKAKVMSTIDSALPHSVSN